MTPPPLAHVVCVPGLGLDARAWRPTLVSLGRAYDVVELPGYGERPSRRDDLRPAALAERLVEEALIDLPAPALLLGHSSSCQVVAHAARLAPERVCGLVLVGPTTDPRGASWPRLVARWLRTAAHERPCQLPVLISTYARTGPLWMLRTMDATRRDDVRLPLRDLACRVLVVRGPHDRICPEDWARALASRAPEGSAAVTLDGGGHMVPLTHGARVAEAVREAFG